MKTKNLTLGLAFILVIMAVIQTVQIAGMKNSFNSGAANGGPADGNAITGNAVAAGGKIDMSGWTENEKMMYDHHGTLPARLNGNSAASGSSGTGGKIDMSGWTENEKMMYDHYGTMPARLQGQQNSQNTQSAPTMVGGC
ncbi:hypothetical protein HYU14_00115 [Candidatus Woesearchaeota archaeon]|nr:hypothetical protein [Candidatus Woesearchaeota archaeon]